MFHEPIIQNDKDPAFAYKRKLGVRMFLVYALLYLSFIVINLLKPVLMETIVIAGLNLAVVYGFSLIIIALILALYYNRACGRREKALGAEGSK